MPGSILVKVIIFTDLDGTLLNHKDYSFAEATASIERIKQSGIPLIFTTSKTRREVELLQQEMGIREPVIIENGGGIVFPQRYRNLTIESNEQMIQNDDYTVIVIGTTYLMIRDFLEKVSARFNIRGFGDMLPAEISALTGLPIERATLAGEREFSEPFIMERTDEIGLLSAFAAGEGLKVTRGGRFHHLIGRDQDKGKAVCIVYDIFRRNSETELTTIGIGDSENDLPMLEQVDIPVLIPRPEKGCLNICLPGLIRAKEEGAKGWNDVVQRILDEMTVDHNERITEKWEENI
jgi:mannosyl-3-phosphoglycerate phosphatase